MLQKLKNRIVHQVNDEDLEFIKNLALVFNESTYAKVRSLGEFEVNVEEPKLKDIVNLSKIKLKQWIAINGRNTIHFYMNWLLPAANDINFPVINISEIDNDVHCLTELDDRLIDPLKRWIDETITTNNLV